MKKITLARDIFEKKERERQRQRQFVPIINLNLSPQKIEVIKKLINNELKRNEETKIDKLKKFIGNIFAILIILAAILGAVWLIKIFIGGIFG